MNEKQLYRNDITLTVAVEREGRYIVIEKDGRTKASYATLEELLAKNPDFLDWEISRDLTDD